MIPTFGTASVSLPLTSAASSELMQIVAAELRSGFDECVEEQSAFDGGRTNRFNQVLHHPALIEHEWV